MDYAGVDHALLHTNPMLGRDTTFLAECVQHYPDRLHSMAPVDEWRIIDETDQVVAELQQAIGERGLHAIKFNTRPAYQRSPQAWDDGPYRLFWQAATALHVPIFHLGHRPGQRSRRDLRPRKYPGLSRRATDPNQLDAALPRHRLQPDTRLSLAGFPKR